jgi:uncharacterized membrane-anchored protein
MAFIPLPEAARIMRALGNVPSPNFLGLVISMRENDSWMASIRYLPEGYIRDDDAKEWNAGELLESLKEGTEEGNKDRKARGFPEIEVVGWIEEPAYSSETHRLIWSASLRDKGASSEAEQTVNYNTYVLGREGYFGLNFITMASTIEREKPIAHQLLARLRFDPGKRYEDFNESTDKVAAHGLAALVGGAVLKKAGILTVIAALAVKFGKVAILLAVGLFGGLFKFFRRKDR